MQAAQSAVNAIAGYTDLFASLQTVQATVQTQVEHFNALMAEIGVIGNARQDEAGVRAVGNIALKLHRVHTLLYGGTTATAVAPASQPQGAATGAADLDLQNALTEFSTLLATSQSNSQEVAALLAAAAEELAQLRASTN
jgi:hypothetical protein